MTTDGTRRTAVDSGLAISARGGGLTYEFFYGLTQKPFSLSSDPAFFYNSNAHSAAFDALLSGINRRESLSVLSGDIGMGKTTLCRSVLQHLDRRTVSAFVPDPFASREDLLKVVLTGFGVISADDVAAGRLRGASRTELSYLLYEFLETLAPLQAFAVIFIDEAQNLSLPLLEEMRILSDADTQLQVVMVGQLELRDKLRLPEMRQLAQRVTVRCSLDALDRDGVAGYISHRLHVAGGVPERVRFSHEAIDAIYEASRGVPRVINRLCDRALYYGQSRHAAIVDPAAVRMATEDVDPHLLTAPAPAAAMPTDAPGPGAENADVNELSETWFAKVDAQVNRASEGADTIGVTTIADLAAARPSAGVRYRPEPLTHMEMLQRIWVRRLAIAALLAIVVGGAGLGLSVAYAILDQPVVSPSIKRPVAVLRQVPPPAAPLVDSPSDDGAAIIEPVDIPPSSGFDSDNAN